jgi:hypothetical protein
MTCLVNSVVTSCNYDYIVGQNGSAPGNASGTPTGIFGYDTTLTLSRVCMPSSVTLTYFDGMTSSSTSSSVTSSVSGGYLSNLIQDITNVKMEIILELANIASWFWSCHYHLVHCYAIPSMVYWMYGMVIYPRTARFPNRSWIHLMLLRRIVR